MATVRKMVDPAVSLKPRQEAETLIPRKAGRCGTCGGFLSPDKELEADVCKNCGRQAPPLTPEEIRANILRKLTSQAEGLLSPEDFAATYVSLADLGRICGVSKKSFREWLKYHGWKFAKRRSSSTGKWAHYVTVKDAQAVIEARR